MSYNEHYNKAIKYNKEENHFSDVEGHQIHDNGGPLIYADWLQDKGYEHLPNFIRQVIQKGEHNPSNGMPSYLRMSVMNNDVDKEQHKSNQPHMFVFRSGGYDNIPSTMMIKLKIPSSISGKHHSYYSEDLPHKEGKELYTNLKSEGVLDAKFP